MKYIASFFIIIILQHHNAISSSSQAISELPTIEVTSPDDSKKRLAKEKSDKAKIEIYEYQKTLFQRINSVQHQLQWFQTTSEEQHQIIDMILSNNKAIPQKYVDDIRQELTFQQEKIKTFNQQPDATLLKLLRQQVRIKENLIAYLKKNF